MNYPKFHHKHLKILCKSFWHSIQWILSLWMYLCNLESCRKDTQHSYCKFGGRTATQFAIQNAFKVTFHHRLWKQKTQLCGNLSHFASAPTRGGTQHISTQYLHQRAPSLCIPYITACTAHKQLSWVCALRAAGLKHRADGRASSAQANTPLILGSEQPHVLQKKPKSSACFDQDTLAFHSSHSVIWLSQIHEWVRCSISMI